MLNSETAPGVGDIPPETFRAAAHRAADLLADYLEGVGRYAVLPPVRPGEVSARLPAAAPEAPEPMETILEDYRTLIEPNVTHWNHPGFMAYFGITGSGPGVLGEALAAGLNVNAMLWRTGPAPTELEERVCDWLRQLLGLPEAFKGHINDTASIATFLALAAARERSVPNVRARGLAGRPELGLPTVYCSDQAHSSVDKAMIALGLGLEQLRRIPSDERFRMDTSALRAAIEQDRRAKRNPIALVATLGTTSTTSLDPAAELAEVAAREKLWLHVDAAYAGSAAICPEFRAGFAGWERADSIVTNPHKWLFTPVDCSVLFVRDPAALKRAFALVPEYLRTPEAGVTNLMDYGIQLGRRFRALKLWFVLRAFGAEGCRARIRAHCALAQAFASWVAAEPDFEVCAPVPFSTVCFRAVPDVSAREQDAFNEKLLEQVNATGEVFLSHTKLRGRYVLRMAIGNLRTTEGHVRRAWDALRNADCGMRNAE
ncbi:MAG: pyridoxal-dependent decarboxylase [Planctomycetota bacterium]|nr:pyridoxal-dependent decarboxylase [Planctomycetota bacterium]